MTLPFAFLYRGEVAAAHTHHHFSRTICLNQKNACVRPSLWRSPRGYHIRPPLSQDFVTIALLSTFVFECDWSLWHRYLITSLRIHMYKQERFCSEFVTCCYSFRLYSDSERWRTTIQVPPKSTLSPPQAPSRTYNSTCCRYKCCRYKCWMEPVVAYEAPLVFLHPTSSRSLPK